MFCCKHPVIDRLTLGHPTIYNKTTINVQRFNIVVSGKGKPKWIRKKRKSVSVWRKILGPRWREQSAWGQVGATPLSWAHSRWVSRCLLQMGVQPVGASPGFFRSGRERRFTRGEWLSDVGNGCHVSPWRAHILLTAYSASQPFMLFDLKDFKWVLSTFW